MAHFPSLTIKPVKRSNFDLSKVNRFSTQPGLLNVCYTQMCVPGDVFHIKPYFKVETLPLKAPMLGRFAVQTDFYYVPFRLYCPDMRTNVRKLFVDGKNDIDDYQLPKFRFQAGITKDGTYIVPDGNLAVPDYPFVPGTTQRTDDEKFVHMYAIKNNSLLNQLGFPIGFMDLTPADNGTTITSGNSSLYVGKYYNAHLMLAYYDIFRNYYANVQESYYYARRSFSTNSSFDTIKKYLLSDLDNWFSNGVTNVSGDNMYSRVAQQLYASFFAPVDTSGGTTPVARVAMEGLVYRTYKPDYLTNWINQSAYNTAVQNSGLMLVDSSNNTISVNQIRMSNRLLKRAEKILIAGGRYGEYIRSLFTIDTNPELSIPEYIGGAFSYMDFQGITQQSGGEKDYAPGDGKYPLGSRVSRGTSIDTVRPIHVNCDDYGYIVGICSIIPIPDYSTGVPREFTNTWLSDFYDPTLDRFGFQALYKSEFDATPRKYQNVYTPWGFANTADGFDNSDPFTAGVAYTPAFMEMTTALNRNYGLLGYDKVFGGREGSLNFWTINRTFDRGVWYAQDPTIGSPRNTFSISSYIFPTDYNVSFVDQSASAQNFIIQYSFDVKAKRPKSKKLIPNLG